MGRFIRHKHPRQPRAAPQAPAAAQVPAQAQPGVAGQIPAAAQPSAPLRPEDAIQAAIREGMTGAFDPDQARASALKDPDASGKFDVDAALTSEAADPPAPPQAGAPSEPPPATGPAMRNGKIMVTCGKCSAVLGIEGNLAGQLGKCPKCGAVLIVPNADGSVPSVKQATANTYAYQKKYGVPAGAGVILHKPAVKPGDSRAGEASVSQVAQKLDSRGINVVSGPDASAAAASSQQAPTMSMMGVHGLTPQQVNDPFATSAAQMMQTTPPLDAGTPTQEASQPLSIAGVPAGAGGAGQMPPGVGAITPGVPNAPDAQSAKFKKAMIAMGVVIGVLVLALALSLGYMLGQDGGSSGKPSIASGNTPTPAAFVVSFGESGTTAAESRSHCPARTDRHAGTCHSAHAHAAPAADAHADSAATTANADA